MDEECQICWGENEYNTFTTLACCPDKTYHNICIMKWLHLSNSCPFCRREHIMVHNNNAITYVQPEIEIIDNSSIIICSIYFVMIFISLLFLLLKTHISTIFN